MMFRIPLLALFMAPLLVMGSCVDEPKILPLDPVEGEQLRGLDLDRDIVSTIGKQIYAPEACSDLCARFLKPGEATVPTWLAPIITAVRADDARCITRECGDLRSAVERGDTKASQTIQSCTKKTREVGGVCYQALAKACVGLCERSLTARPSAAGVSTGDEGIGLAWSFKPSVLMVYRPTQVRFTLDTPPRDHPNARCVWNLGTERLEGCQISHTFENGRADQWVTLELIDGDWRWKSTKRIALERLPVVKLKDSGPATDGIPAAPKTAERSFRFAVIADSAAQGGVHEDVKAAMKALVEHVKPDLVVHAGGLVAPQSGNKGWRLAQDGVMAPLSAARIPASWVMSPNDRKEGARVPRPGVTFIDDSKFPDRYTFSMKGAFFMVFSADTEEGVDEKTLRWIRQQLNRAQVYAARFVFSYLPLHKYGDAHVGSLRQKLRLYELFLRGRVNTFFSAGYRVYYKGRYGTLPVVSVGSLARPGGKLAGSTLEQPPSFVVADVVKGVPKRIFAVEGPDFNHPLAESRLPLAVEIYNR